MKPYRANQQRRSSAFGVRLAVSHAGPVWSDEAQLESQGELVIESSNVAGQTHADAAENGASVGISHLAEADNPTRLRVADLLAQAWAAQIALDGIVDAIRTRRSLVRNVWLVALRVSARVAVVRGSVSAGLAAPERRFSLLPLRFILSLMPPPSLW